jgi:hypothetical protein
MNTNSQKQQVENKRKFNLRIYLSILDFKLLTLH